MSAESKIRAARTDLVLREPFFGALALGLKMVPDPGCGTAWVDGRSMGYEPSFVESLNHDQVTALVAHEVMHVAMGHPWRRDARSMKPWNVACDKAINGELRESGFTLPPDALYPEGDESGKSSEWIFERVRDSKPDDRDGSGPGNAPGNNPAPGVPDPLGEVRDAPTDADGDGDPAPSEQEWKQKVQAAAMQARAQGKLPGSMARAVSEALKPQIDIRSLLLRFFSERSTGDYSWSRPNTRYIAQGLYLPCLESKELGEIAIGIDTSGSVNTVSLAYARGLVESTIEECAPASVSVFYFDSKVHGVDRFDKGDPLTWQPQGGGGTSFVEVLKQIEDEGTAVCALMITDMCGTFPESCDIPVLWLATTDIVAPFGETVPVDR
jgi:predicted metal-dependent peptidase